MVSHITWQPKCRLILGVLCGWGEDTKLSFSCLKVGRPMQQKDTVQADSEGILFLTTQNIEGSKFQT